MSAAVRAGYKLTEVGVIPEDWKLVALGEVAATSSGTTPARDLADRYYRNGTVHWVKTLDLNNSDLADTDEQVTLTAVDETSLRPYPVGTVLVAMYGGFNQIGRTGLLRISAAVNQAITAIQPHAAKLQSEYLLATLNFRVDYWKTVASSSRKDPNITSQDVRAFPIAFPSLPEQRAIATALSGVDALLAKLDALIAKKRDLKVAAMQQLLTGQTRLPGFSGEWKRQEIGSQIDLLTGFPFPSSRYADSGVRLLRGSNVKRGETDWHEDLVQFWPAVTQDIKRYELETDDLVIAMDGSLVGRSYARLKSEDLPAVLLQRVARIRSKTIDVGFLNQIVGSEQFVQYCDSVKTVTAIPHISASDIRNFELALPPTLEEQTAIATVLSDMDTELTALEARRDKTRALKQGMMQELLTGRIRLI